jgi:hypothetical protein
VNWHGRGVTSESVKTAVQNFWHLLLALTLVDEMLHQTFPLDMADATVLLLLLCSQNNTASTLAAAANLW